MKYKAGERRRASEYEKALVEWWKENRTFEKSIEQRPIDNSYVFYDGPPFITGLPHHGTLLSSIVKDAVPRYWTMNGKRCERRWGWDCHGLPAENFVEKQLGITDRREIGTKWPLSTYIEKARESMVANSETWEGTIERVGRWVDFKGAYRTMDRDFMESVWWAFKTLYEKGKIYEGRKVLMYDTKFCTPVSKSEVTMDNDAYQTVTDPSAYVKFKVVGGENSKKFLPPLSFGRLPSQGPQSKQSRNSARSSEIPLNSQQIFLLAWTTTPWTLPANMALAVSGEMKYVGVKVEGSEDILILAESRKEAVLAGLDYEVVLDGLTGADLAGLSYEPLFENEKTQRDTYTVLTADFVSDADGTGIVHIAPAYGEDDYRLMNEHELDFVDVLTEDGHYEKWMAEQLHQIGVRDTDEEGIEIWAGNKFIAKCLEEKGVVWKIEYIKHEYPFNPRSKQRIMYRAFPSWFFDVEGSKPLMLEENENINWFPEYLKHGRFAKNIEQAPDWNLSRDRFWATAMPVWKGDKGSVRVVGSYDELYELSGVRLEDYHRPWVDEIEFDIDGEHFRRIEKVLDCWFESGSMPFAQLHYPFENKEKFEQNYPADFIVEYVGQVRAWFYYVHCVNTALFGHNAYKNVITTGTLAGNDGRKMSKSLGNYTDPNILMDQYSADALRFLLLSSPVLSGEDFALLDKDVSDVARKLAMIWNVYDFFTTYAEVDGWDSSDSQALSQLIRRSDSQVFSSSTQAPSMSYAGAPEEPSFGRTLRARQEYTSQAPESEMIQKTLANRFTPNKSETPANRSTPNKSETPANRIENPLDSWIISRIWQLRDDITEGMEKYDLPDALDSVLPFIDDLSNWFVRRSRRRFWKSEDDDDKAEAYATLYYVLVYLSKILAPFVPFLAEELYQKMGGAEERVCACNTEGGCECTGAESVHLCDWPEAGAIDMEVIEQMARARAIIETGLSLRMQKSETEEQIKVRQPLALLTYDGERLPEFYEKIIAEEVNVKEVRNDATTRLDKTLTPELLAEGYARELIRKIQAERKNAGLNVDDRIRLEVVSELQPEYYEMVKAETLAVEFSHVTGEKIEIKLAKI